MKPFMGIDLTTDKKNEQLNGDQFLAARTSPALAQALERSTVKAETTLEEAKLPMALRIIQWISGFAALLIGGGILKALPDVGFRQGYANAPVLFWIVGICLPLWLVLKLLSIRKQKAVLSLDENQSILTGLERTREAVFSDLSVPAHAKEVDLLTFHYKVKNGEIKPVEKGMQVTPYVNTIFQVYTDDSSLYIANLYGKYAFPLSGITAIRTVRKHIRVSNWNKDEACDKGVYKPYKLTRDNYGCVHCKKYHILEIAAGGETWGIWFPSYELPMFEALTGRKAQE